AERVGHRRLGAVDDRAALVDRDRAESVVDRFAEAANAGDRAAVAALFAPDARFDSVGRIYPDRAAIMDRFLGPEVLDAGGRYAPGEQRWEGDRLVVAYEFTTRSGGRERFTYAYLVRDGVIRDVVGRYLTS
ncbi:nuclear transport factor 2 family protein, partial [Asanoa sp. NPDC050611]|uniref:nuclear transport factor 2 family protein n=1 Tax=Asanoa sp. NPDC050611 TaxID=3157098 RepID=UPI0033EEEEAC